MLKSETTPMSRQEKYTLLVFVLVVAMWLLPGIIAPVLPEVASAISSLGTPTPGHDRSVPAVRPPCGGEASDELQ